MINGVDLCARMSFLKEFWNFLRARKKFWLLPVLLALMLPWRRKPAEDSVAQPGEGNNFEEHTGGLLPDLGRVSGID